MRATVNTCLALVSQLIGCSHQFPILKTCSIPGAFPFENGQCYVPSSSAPCREGEWAVVTNSTLTCEDIPCGPVEVLLDGICSNLFDPIACPDTGERLFLDRHGQGFCDCDNGWGRWEDGSCYQEFTRGFCEENQIIRKSNKEKSCQAQTKNNEYEDCVFPFVVKSQVYTGCAAEHWPETLSEEVEGTPWCPTLLYSNKTLTGDNWGLCTESCPISRNKNSIIFNDEIRKLRLFMNPSSEVHCEDNPCGDPRLSLPHISTWSEKRPVCHQVHHTLKGCEVFLDSDDNLKCCDPENSLKCEVEENLATHTVLKTCLGEDRCRCDDGYIWSEFRLQCVQLFRVTKYKTPEKNELNMSETTVDTNMSGTITEKTETFETSFQPEETSTTLGE